LYIGKLSKEEIQLDCNKIYWIDYESHKWLNTSEHEYLISRLEEYNKQSANAIIENDFVEYCRTVCLQIEVLLNKFIVENYGDNNLQYSEFSKFNKLQDFFKIVRENFNIYEDPEYKIVTNIMSIRDIASHGDYNGTFLVEKMIDLKGKFIEIRLDNLDNKINKAILEERILNLFSEFVMDKKRLKVKLYAKQGTFYFYAYVKMMFNLKNTYLDYQLIKNYLDDKNHHNYLKLQLGNEFTYSKSKEHNELKDFFEQQDYAQIKHTMNWFIQEIGKHIK
jgi:hypothetical protein